MTHIFNYVWILILFLPIHVSGKENACNAPLFTVTDSINTTSFQLNWTDFNEEALGWEIEWGELGFIRTNEPNTELITDTHYKLTTLEAGTAYEFYIRAVCSESEVSNWNGPFKANTAIDNNEACNLNLAIRDNNCPRLENFHIDVTGFEGMALGADIFIQSVDIIIDHDWPADLQMYLISPSGNRILLSKNRGIGLDNYGNPSDSTCIEVCSFSDFACTPISEVGTDQLIGSFLPEENIYDIYDEGAVNGLWKISMCDRALEDRGVLKYASINFAPVICNVPTEIVARNISDSTATIQWAPPENCRVAIINVVFSGQSPGTNIEIFTSCQSGQFEVSGLLPETAYDIYIRSDCNSSKSAFSCPASFITACNIVTLSSDFEDFSLCLESCNSICPINDVWENSSNDQQDWILHSGPTTTDNTGPEGDISGVGNYVYLENTIDLCGPQNKAILEATCIEISDNAGPCNMSFYYHMYGENIDSLILKISNDNGLSWDNIFEAYGDQGKVWHRQFIDLTDYQGQLVSFRFEALSGQDDRADIALDQIEFYGSSQKSILPLFYFDGDRDGYGGQDSIVSVCLNLPPVGFTNDALDCDDSNPNIYPGAPEIQCNLIDENCNGNEDDAAENNPILYQVLSVVDESCPGAEDASIRIEVTGGNPPYDIKWNNEKEGFSITDLAEDVYFATIMDAGTCTIVTEFIDIDVISTPQIFFAGSQPSQCNDSTGLIDIEVAGGLAPYTFIWNDGSKNKDRLNISEGVYSVTATDINGCEVTMSEIIIEASPRFTAGIQTKKNLTCIGDSNGIITIGIFNAVEPIVYHWNNGDTTATVTNLALGEYEVTINDARGCEQIISSTISSPQKLETQITGIEQITCFNGSNGSIQAGTSGGSFPYNFEWVSEPQLPFIVSKQEDINNLPPGTYRLHVSDGNGCSDSTQVVTLTNPEDIDVATDSTSNVRCKLSTNGYLSVDVTGGAGEYIYFWGSQDVNTFFIENIQSGTYSLTVIDKFGCKKTVNDLVIGIENIPLQVTTEINNDNICSYDSVGKIIAFVSEGVVPLDFNWSNGRQIIKPILNDTVSMLPGGEYNITITDGEGCVGISEISSISNPKEVGIDNIDLVLNDCNSDAIGSISLSVSGGSPPYNYIWNTGEITPEITELTNGEYLVTVTDDVNCSFLFGPILISGLDPIIPQPQITMVSGGQDNGMINLDIIGGSPPYDIDWDVLTDQVESHEDLAAGSYCVTITDTKGCFVTECYNVDQSDAIYEPEKSVFQLFPNPTSDYLNIISESSVERITLFRIDGAIVDKREFNSSNITFPMSDILPGIYIIKLEIQGKSLFSKVVKTQ